MKEALIFRLMMLKWDARTLNQKLQQRIVWALPRWVIRWAFFRVCGASQTPNVNIMDAIQTWENKR